MGRDGDIFRIAYPAAPAAPPAIYRAAMLGISSRRAAALPPLCLPHLLTAALLPACRLSRLRAALPFCRAPRRTCLLRASIHLTAHLPRHGILPLPSCCRIAALACALRCVTSARENQTTRGGVALRACAAVNRVRSRRAGRIMVSRFSRHRWFMGRQK